MFAVNTTCVWSVAQVVVAGSSSAVGTGNAGRPYSLVTNSGKSYVAYFTRKIMDIVRPVGSTTTYIWTIYDYCIAYGSYRLKNNI